MLDSFRSRYVVGFSSSSTERAWVCVGRHGSSSSAWVGVGLLLLRGSAWVCEGERTSVICRSWVDGGGGRWWLLRSNGCCLEREREERDIGFFF